MNQGRIVVHGHFYQPPRIDPFTGSIPQDPTAAPAHDWNERVSAECYRPNAVLGDLARISWDLGPTLAVWMASADPIAYDGFVAGDRGINGMAQPYHHPIMPLASAEDRRTEIRWGLRDFEYRLGRRPTGMWLPETAVDLPTLRLMAAEGITHTILAPWQIDVDGIETRRPVRIDLGGGRSMVAVLYDGLLSAAVSFEPSATVDADAFVRERLAPRFSQPGLDAGEIPLVVIATDGELYGHHQPGREHFLARLVGTETPAVDGVEMPKLATAIDAAVALGIPTVRLRERTSWSCHHGLARWSTDCDCVPDGDWKGPLRVALDRLAGGIDAATDRLARSLPGSPDPWAARDAYVDVLLARETPLTFAAARLGPAAMTDDVTTFAALLEAQRWRLAMFASCAWFWEDPVRVETVGALRMAVWAARLIDGLAGSGLERRLVDDLRFVVGPGGETGDEIMRSALAAVGQARPSRA